MCNFSFEIVRCTGHVWPPTLIDLWFTIISHPPQFLLPSSCCADLLHLAIPIRAPPHCRALPTKLRTATPLAIQTQSLLDWNNACYNRSTPWRSWAPYLKSYTLHRNFGFGGKYRGVNREEKYNELSILWKTIAPRMRVRQFWLKDPDRSENVSDQKVSLGLPRS